MTGTDNAMLPTLPAGRAVAIAERDRLLPQLHHAQLDAEGLPWLAQKRDLRRRLLDIQFGKRLAYLDAEQNYAEGRTSLAVQQQHGPEITPALAALSAQRDQQVASYAHDVLKDLADAQEKIGTLEQQVLEASHKAEQTVLTAPVAGTVQQLAVHTLGGVVTPAQALLTLVPDDAGLLVEAHIDNKDVGFVHAGQAAEVKVQTFEFTRYGLIHGTVLDVRV